MSTWKKDFERGGETLSVRLRADGDGRYTVHVGDREYAVEAVPLRDGSVRFACGGRRSLAMAVEDREAVDLRLDGHTWRLTLHRGRQATAAGAADGRVTAPMSGTVLSVPVTEGQRVSADDPVAVVTAMKMEHKLTAGVDGVVAEIGVREGEAVDHGMLLVRVEPE